jgi:N-acetylglucosamine kinase-like BadF-type ATPase
MHDGNLVKSGGRGYLLGDRGSGFALGRHALRHYLDGTSPSAQLKLAIMELFGCADEEGIISLVYKSGAPASMVARLLDAFVSDLRAGERYAIEAVELEMTELAQTTAAHITTFFTEQQRPRVGLAGGVWKSASLPIEAFRRALSGILESPMTVTRIAKAPVSGAVMLAKEYGS